MPWSGHPAGHTALCAPWWFVVDNVQNNLFQQISNEGGEEREEEGRGKIMHPAVALSLI